MRIKSVFLSIVLLILTIGAAGTLRSQNAIAPTSDAAEHAKHSLAINLLRAINTAEARYRAIHGVYAPRDVLLASEEFKGRGWSWAAKNDPQFENATPSKGLEGLPGWSLRLNVTADGKSYDALLEDTTDNSCGYAAGTDERGIIRQSKTIGCKI